MVSIDVISDNAVLDNALLCDVTVLEARVSLALTYITVFDNPMSNDRISDVAVPADTISVIAAEEDTFADKEASEYVFIEAGEFKVCVDSTIDILSEDSLAEDIDKERAVFEG